MGLVYYLTHKLDQALDANSNKITNLADGTASGDAVNKGQLDAGGGGDVAGDTHAATSKTTPVNADEIPLADSAASYGLKKLLWSNLKATLKTYFDTLYPSGSGTSTGTNTGDQTTVSGNAGTATALQTSRNIDGQAFNGTADVTVIAPGTHAATSKATPVDADELALVDSAASNVLKKLTWANVKATLKTYFDTLYAPVGGGGPPTGAAGGDLTGTYPNPTIGAGKVVLADLASAVRPGLPQLVYRYTVAGSDKTSIDTGVDTPDAGSNDWTNGDLLEIVIVARTDKAAASDEIDLTFNNDGSAIYDQQFLTAANTTVSGAATVAQSSVRMTVHAANGSASYPGQLALSIAAFGGTTFWKVIETRTAIPDATAGNNVGALRIYGYRSTSALTRAAVTAIGGQKLKVGSQLLIYKRLAS